MKKACTIGYPKGRHKPYEGYTQTLYQRMHDDAELKRKIDRDHATEMLRPITELMENVEFYNVGLPSAAFLAAEAWANRGPLTKLFHLIIGRKAP